MGEKREAIITVLLGEKTERKEKREKKRAQRNRAVNTKRGRKDTENRRFGENLERARGRKGKRYEGKGKTERKERENKRR